MRAGLGFYGKNTMLITRTHGSWVVLGTLVTDVVIEPSTPLDARLRPLHALHRRLPDGRARRAGRARCDEVPLVLDAGARARSRRRTASELGASVYGCDICQDVCPWNHGVERRRRDLPLPAESTPTVSLVEWLSAGRSTSSSTASSASTSRATIPAGCAATPSSRSATWATRRTAAAVEPYAGSRRRDARRDGALGARPRSRSGRRERRPPRRAGARAAEPGRRDRGDRGGVPGRPGRSAATVCSSSPQPPAGTWSGCSRTPRSRRCAAGPSTSEGSPSTPPKPRRSPAGTSLVAAEPSLIVDGDPERLRQALDNLIENALGHAPPGEPGADRRDARRRCRAAVGRPTAATGSTRPTHERIFEAGTRLTDARPGSGLGLAVVRAIVEAHGGRVEVESAPGQGATFTLVLPQASSAPA